MRTTGINDDRKLIAPRPRQLAAKELLTNRRYRQIEAEDFPNDTGVSARCNDVDRSVLDFLKFSRNIDRPQLLCFGAKRAERCPRVNVAVFWTKEAAHQVVTSKLRHELSDIGHGEQFAFDAE